MSFKFDNQFWSTINKDVVLHRKWFLSHLTNDLLTNKLPDQFIQTLTPTQLLKLTTRRTQALQFRNDPSWSEQIYQAIYQLSTGQNDGQALLKLTNSSMLNPFEDYIGHLHCFTTVAKDMISRGDGVVPLGPNGSRIHDLDKLDPIMLAAYAERFEDGLETDLWQVCVKNHVSSSPHHPEHAIWQIDGVCDELGVSTHECPHCEALRYLAVREMICDRVARRVQKEFSSVMSPEAWNISHSWFSGLPEKWFKRAVDIIQRMQQNGRVTMYNLTK